LQMSLVPSELILCVLEHEYYTPWRTRPSGTPNYKLLKACALVCRTWSGPAQSLLFRSVIHIDDRSIHQFFAALLSSAARGRALGDCVRVLEIWIPNDIWIINGGCNQNDFANILLACPRMYQLRLNVIGKSELEEKTLKKLSVAGRRLKALEVFCYEPKSPIPFHVLEMWPNIEFLRIGSTDTMMCGAGELVQRKGAELCLYQLELMTPSTSEVINWLLASSANSLRILDLGRHTIEQHINILAPHAPQLRSLRISCRDGHPGDLKLLRMCTALEELVLYEIPERSPLALNLSPTIECITFETASRSVRSFSLKLQAVIDVVDALPNLKVVTYRNQWQEESVEYDLEVLEAKCRVKGVEVVISDMPPWVGYEDPVKVKRFPRTRSVSNFGAMS
ncbi:hypothetical protein K503DRAFT_703566, partial [Rhizopogon vinicolor AM-OR11-026]